MDGARSGSHTSKLGKFFLMPLPLRMPIDNKNFLRTRAENCREVFVAIFTSIEVVLFFETFDRSCPMKFFVVCTLAYIRSDKDIRKNVLTFEVCEQPAPPATLYI